MRNIHEKLATAKMAKLHFESAMEEARGKIRYYQDIFYIYKARVDELDERIELLEAEINKENDPNVSIPNR